MISRYRRTILLAVLATATFVWAAIDRFDVPTGELLGFMLYSAIGVLGIIVLAAVFVALLHGLAWLLRQLRREREK
jgi:hypothetical protein